MLHTSSKFNNFLDTSSNDLFNIPLSVLWQTTQRDELNKVKLPVVKSVCQRNSGAKKIKKKKGMKKARNDNRRTALTFRYLGNYGRSAHYWTGRCFTYRICSNLAAGGSAARRGAACSVGIECSSFRRPQPHLERATWSQCSRHIDHVAHADSPRAYRGIRSHIYKHRVTMLPRAAIIMARNESGAPVSPGHLSHPIIRNVSCERRQTYFRAERTRLVRPIRLDWRRSDTKEGKEVDKLDLSVSRV